MKNVGMLLTMFFLIGAAFGCAITPGPPPTDPVCERPEFVDSWICSQLKATGFQYAEDAQDILLDANDIALIMDVYTVEQFMDVLNEFEGYLNIEAMAYTYFFNSVVSDTGKAKRLGMILRRRFAILKSPEIIRESDRQLLRMSIHGLRDSV